MTAHPRNLFRRWWSGLRGSRGDLRADLVAGLTVAVLSVPQGMAYALIAGLPPVYGLYTAIVPCLVSALFGSSRHLVLGPTNASCMVILSLTAPLPEKYGIGLLPVVFFLTLLTGVVQLIFAALRLGSIVRYVSNSVVVGFTAGAGILIAVNQLQNILGIDLRADRPEGLHGVLFATFRHLRDANPFAVILGVGTAIVALAAPKIHRRLPGALLGLVVATLLCTLLGWQDRQDAWRVEIVRGIEAIRGGLPHFHVPDLALRPHLELTREVLTGAVALALLGLIEVSTAARSMASRSGQRIDFNREFLGLGLANVVGSAFSCHTASGSLMRTSVNHAAGGRTRRAAMFSAMFTALALVFLAPLANLVPKAALAGILIVVAYSMVDKHRLKLAWSTAQHPRMVLVATLGSALFLPLEFAILVGVFLSLVFVLRATGKIDLTQLVPRVDQGFDEVPFNRAAPAPVAIVNMEGDLYFAAAEDLDHELLRCVTPKTRVIVLRMKRLRAVGGTAMAMLEHFWRILRWRGITLVVCGIEDELKSAMTASGVRSQIGEQNIFYADNRLLQSTELAIARAWSIVHSQERRPAVSAAESASAGTDTAAGPVQVRAKEQMSTRCIRFGNRHQLREAVWLMSGLLEHSQSTCPEPLFLQDREGRLAGELTLWQVLRVLTEGLSDSDARELSDPAVAERMRRDFTRTIDAIARAEIVRVDEEASLARMLEGLVRGNLQVLPVCDEGGRLVGQVSAQRVVQELDRQLRERESRSLEERSPQSELAP